MVIIASSVQSGYMTVGRSARGRSRGVEKEDWTGMEGGKRLMTKKTMMNIHRA